MELHDIYSSPTIIREIEKKGGVGWAGHVVFIV